MTDLASTLRSDVLQRSSIVPRLCPFCGLRYRCPVDAGNHECDAMRRATVLLAQQPHTTDERHPMMITEPNIYPVIVTVLEEGDTAIFDPVVGPEHIVRLARMNLTNEVLCFHMEVEGAHGPRFIVRAAHEPVLRHRPAKEEPTDAE